MKKSFLFTLCAVAFCPAVQAKLFNQTVLDEPQPVHSAAGSNISRSALAVYMQGTKDLKADFIQLVYSKRGTEKSSGRMWIAKPNKFYWDYQQPDPQKIISNGKVVYHYDIGLEQISVRRQDELVGGIAVKLLNGKDDISANYHVTTVAKTNAPLHLQKYVGQGVVYRLLPKTPQNDYDALWVVLQGTQINAVMIDGGSGQQTVLAFSHMKRNSNIPAKQFDFTPPPGVDVVGNISG